MASPKQEIPKGVEQALAQLNHTPSKKRPHPKPKATKPPMSSYWLDGLLFIGGSFMTAVLVALGSPLEWFYNVGITLVLCLMLLVVIIKVRIDRKKLEEKKRYRAANELAKWSRLRREKAISHQEFMQKKKEILGNK